MNPDKIQFYETSIFQHHFSNHPSNGYFYFGIRYYNAEIVTLPSDGLGLYHFYVVLTGSGFLRNEKGMLFPLTPETAFQLFDDSIFELVISSEVPFSLYEICLGNYTYQALMAAELISESGTVFPIRLAPHLEKWMQHALADALYNHPEPMEIYFNLQKLLIALHQQNQALNSRSMIAIIESAKQILCSGYQKDLSLESVAQNLGMSYENFRKIFKEQVGLSPLQFRLHCKFYYAQSLLSHGCSIKETALKTGYQDPFIFSKQFKKYVGNPPSYYRKAGTTPSFTESNLP